MAPVVSVLIELDNLRRAAAWCTEAMLSEVHRQLDLLATPHEVLIGAPGETVPGWVDQLLNGVPESGSPRTSCRAVPVGAARYYEAKNALAAYASGEILVFLDSDVIPCDGWLSNLLTPFEDPGIQVVCSRPVVGPDESVYSRAVAATWIFDPTPRQGVESTHGFFANSVAFRRQAFLRQPFPVNRDEYRGAEVLLADHLAASGTAILRANGSVVWHPAPLGLRGFAMWHLLDGQDRAQRWSSEPPVRFVTKVVLSLFGGTTHTLRTSRSRRASLSLSCREQAVAALLAIAGPALRSFGEVLGRVRPSLLRRFL